MVSDLPNCRNFKTIIFLNFTFEIQIRHNLTIYPVTRNNYEYEVQSKYQSRSLPFYNSTR